MTEGIDNSPVVRSGDVQVDLGRRLVHRNGAFVRLTRTEWLLVEQLALNAGRVMRNNELLMEIWGPEYEDDLQFLQVWISRLRRKLEPQPGEQTVIKTMQRMGYVLDGHLKRATDRDVS